VLGDVLAWLVKLVNKIFWPFIHRSYLQVDRAYTFASDAADGVSALRQNPRGLIKPLFLALLSKTLLVIIFLLTFLAFQVPFSAGTIIAGFSIGYLPNIEIEHIDTGENLYQKEKEKIASNDWEAYKTMVNDYQSGKLSLYYSD